MTDVNHLEPPSIRQLGEPWIDPGRVTGFLSARGYGTLNGMATSRLLEDRYPKRATQWRLRTRTLELGRRPLLMGIVNVTPDSFSDGGQFADHEDAIEHALQLAAEGADILDIGGESTRPYSDAVAVEEELQRVIPVVEALAKRTRVPISIDTSKAIVAKAAVFAGAEIINDVTGLAGDPAMMDVAVESAVGICAMHMQGTPQTMQDDPRYDDVVEEIYVSTWVTSGWRCCTAAGIEPRTYLRSTRASVSARRINTI